MSRITFRAHTHEDTNAEMPGCPWTEDRWPRSGSDPGSDDVLYHYNLLPSILPTAVLDNMFHPLRADTGTILLLFSNTYTYTPVKQTYKLLTISNTHSVCIHGNFSITTSICQTNYVVLHWNYYILYTYWNYCISFYFSC